MAKFLQIETGERFGGKGGAPDVSDNLADMGNYEATINNEVILGMMAKLKVVEYDSKTGLPIFVKRDSKGVVTWRYEFLVLEVSDIEDFEAKSMGAAGHGINSQFAVLGAPYRAIPFSSNDEKDKKKDNKGYKVQTDCIKIYRTGEEFDSSLYAVKEWGKMNHPKKDEKTGITPEPEEMVYESYTKGQELRAEKFIADIDEKLLAKVGIKTA